MKPYDVLTRRLERIVSRMEQIQLDAYLRYVNNWKRRLFSEFMNGVMRGIGFSVGFTILGALLIAVLRQIALSNLPVIGRFLAKLVRLVESNL